MGKDGKYFTIKELTNSVTANNRGIKNTPTAEHENNLSTLIKELLDPIREEYGKPITISSGYRSQALNVAVGGSPTSNHAMGCAADCVCAEIDKLFEIAKKYDFDECFKESRDIKDKKGNIIGKSWWLHLAYKKGDNKKEIGTLHNDIFLTRNF